MRWLICDSLKKISSLTSLDRNTTLVGLQALQQLAGQYVSYTRVLVSSMVIF